MDEAIIQKVLHKYGIAYRSIGQPQKGYRNSSHKITLHDGSLANLIFYKSEPLILNRIREANRTSDFLHGHSLPTRQTLGPILKLQSGNQVRYCALYSYLPGETIPWEAYAMDHLKALGMAMSVMHAKLQYLPIAASPRISDEYRPLIERMARYFDDPNVRRAMSQKLGLRLQIDPTPWLTLLDYCDQLHGQQQLHMDFVRGNILFASSDPATQLSVNKACISGILDFEKAGKGHPILDIARTLAFLLVDCKYKTERQVCKYFLHSGYRKRGSAPLPLQGLVRPGQSTTVLEELVSLFLIYDFYKFLRHNPYESLGQNLHFVRTKEILLKRKIIAQVNAKIVTTN